MERHTPRREQIDTTLEMDPFTNDDFKRISQELLNDDANAHRIIGDAREEIQERYRLLFAKNPEKGEDLELRHLKKITKSAFSAIVYGDILDIARDILASEGSFLPLTTDGDFSDTNFYIRYHAINNKLFTQHVRYKGSAGHHLGATNLFLSRISQDSINSLMEDQAHPHYNVGQLANSIDHDAYLRKCSLENPSDRTDLFMHWPLSTTSDNAKVGLELMLHLWLSASRHSGHPLTKEEFTPIYLTHIDVLSRASTIKGDLHIKLHGTSPCKDFHQQENKQLPIDEIFPYISTVFEPTNTPNRYTYTHPSLTYAPWPQARSCPATTELTLPDPDKQQAADDFFNYFTDRFGVEVSRSIYDATATKGECSRTNALLLMTLLFAEHTVLDNLPIQPHLFPGIQGTL